jgi:hypothetical protein
MQKRTNKHMARNNMVKLPGIHDITIALRLSSKHIKWLRLDYVKSACMSGHPPMAMP